MMETHRGRVGDVALFLVILTLAAALCGVFGLGLGLLWAGG